LLAQRFTGSNNVPLFQDIGQFGYRTNGGAAASARYIKTRLEKHTSLLYRQEDEVLYTQRNDNGDLVEWDYYVPILPVILLNGCLGIGTGWKSDILQYNPIDIVEWIKCWIECKGIIEERDIISTDENFIFYKTPELIPWWRGFKGKVEVLDKGKINTYGIVEKVNDKVYHITDLPIGYWTDDFKSFLDILKHEKKISNYRNNSKVNNVEFEIMTLPDGIIPSIESLNLVSKFNTNNMVLFIENDGVTKIKKFNTVEEILIAFCTKRLKFYELRKERQLKDLRDDLKWILNKIRFLKAILLEGGASHSQDVEQLIIFNRDEDEIYKEMEEYKFDKKEESYDYLLKLPIGGVTKNKLEKLQKEKEKTEKSISDLEQKEPSKIWIEELDEFVIEYKIWLVNEEKKDKLAMKKKK
jgi:DNA topoisomerase-2